MFEKFVEAIWKLKMPKKYRNHTDEEIEAEYEMVKWRLLALSKRKDDNGEKFLECLKENEDLITAMQVVEQRRFEEFLSRK